MLEGWSVGELESWNVGELEDIANEKSEGSKDSLTNKEIVLLTERTRFKRMELLELKACDIHRDGGSIEGTWTTNDGPEWTISLKVSSWPHPDDFDNRTFKLFNCELDNVSNSKPVAKASLLGQTMIDAVEQWLTKNNLELTDLKQPRFFNVLDLLEALRRGNY